MSNDVVITGIGLVSSLGVGVDTHIKALTENTSLTPNINDDLCKPYPVHPLPEIDWSEQIPRRGDQRQMENWQRLGVFSAGLALDDAGFKGDLEACGSMDMIVAAGGGERDIAADSLIIEEGRSRNDRAVLLNEKISTEIRPTLFLAQLPNLMAGNISIVHKVTGSSRTFMGEEGAGISSVDIAHARIRSGQSTHCLVGGAFVSERDDLLYTMEAINELEMSPARPFWQRDKSTGRGGVVLGTMGVFLILESKDHAEARNAKIYATLDHIAGDRGARDDDKLNARLKNLMQDCAATDAEDTLIISGASGATGAKIGSDITAQEKAFLASEFPNSNIRTTAAAFGHSFEPHFPFGIALAAMAIKSGKPISTFADEMDKPMDKAAEKAIVTSLGHQRTEGIATLSKA